MPVAITSTHCLYMGNTARNRSRCVPPFKPHASWPRSCAPDRQAMNRAPPSAPRRCSPSGTLRARTSQMPSWGRVSDTRPQLGIWLVRARSVPLGEHLRGALGGALFMAWRSGAHDRGQDACGLNGGTQRERFRAVFHMYKQWVLVMATGIAVRLLDGLPRNKHSDPAVVVLDEAARYAISLLAGHEGGANRLAYRLAQITGAAPVVTTATEALKPMTIGIGCRRGAGVEPIDAAVKCALGGRSVNAVREVATIDLKANEPGIQAFCARYALPLRVFTHAQIAARPWTVQPSIWVRDHIGLDGVCEPCALLASVRGRLAVAKTALDGVAVAVAEDAPEWMD